MIAADNQVELADEDVNAQAAGQCIPLIACAEQTVNLQVNIQYQCFNGRIVWGLHDQIWNLMLIKILPVVLGVLNDLWEQR